MNRRHLLTILAALLLMTAVFVALATSLFASPASAGAFYTLDVATLTVGADRYDSAFYWGNGPVFSIVFTLVVLLIVTLPVIFRADEPADAATGEGEGGSG